MRKYRKAVFFAGAICLLAVFYLYAQRYEGKLESCENSAVIIIEGTPLTADQVKDMLKREQQEERPRDFAAWGQNDDVTVENTDLNRSVKAAAVAVCGRSDLVLRGSVWLDTEDKNGCLVDEKTLRQLFGSTDAAGMAIQVGGREKIVRGVLYDVEDTILYQADREDGQILTKMTVSMDTQDTYETIRQNFMMVYGVDGRFLKMDILYEAAGFLCLLIPLLAGLRILLETGRLLWKVRKEKECLWYRVGMFFCLGVLGWFLVSNLRLPSDMIPPKWSDFDFWKTWWENEKESFLLLLLTEKQKPHQNFLSDFYQVLKYTGLSGLLILLFPVR